MAKGFTHQQMYKSCLILCIICFACWGIQLGGVASLQAACSDDLPVYLNNMDDIKASMAAAKQLTLMLSTTAGTAQQVQGMTAQTFGATLKAMQGLASRSTMGVFTFEPDHQCRMIYRYQWFNTAAQMFVLCLIALSIAFKMLNNSRITLSCLLVVVTMLAIENAHSLLTLKDTVPELTLLRGKIFFAGCVGTGAFNLLMIFALGMRADEEDTRDGASSVPDSQYKDDLEGGKGTRSSDGTPMRN